QLDARVPAWDAAAWIPRRCPFCSADGVADVIRPDGLTVRRCAVCDGRFVSPGPLPLEEQAIDPCVPCDPCVDGSDVRLREPRSLGNRKVRRALDIGCGPGGFLASLQPPGCPDGRGAVYFWTAR